MGRPRKQRRKAHGSAWHWKQTDCWYYTLPGSKKRTSLLDEQGERIRGKENQALAEMALARVKVANESGRAAETNQESWLVAKACSEYLQYCQRGVASGTISQGHHSNAASWLNDLCGYCGAMRILELKKGHIKTWLEKHPSWRSPATQRGVLSVVLAAFNHAEQMHSVPSPLKGLKKPRSQPKLDSFSTAVMNFSVASDLPPEQPILNGGRFHLRTFAAGACAR